jgi:hypothetical protein
LFESPALAQFTAVAGIRSGSVSDFAPNFLLLPSSFFLFPSSFLTLVSLFLLNS